MTTNPTTGLPEFMAGHLLVAFHREDPDAYERALAALSPEDQKLQIMLEEREDEDYPSRDVIVVDNVADAEGVTSYSGIADPEAVAAQQVNAILHRPVLDLDMNAALIPSATPGHFHLYIDNLVPWAAYEELLEALANCGIIEQGYADASIARGYSSARLPTKPKVLADGAL